MKASIENLKMEFNAAVFEKDVLGFRDMSEPKQLLPLLAKQGSISDVELKV